MSYYQIAAPQGAYPPPGCPPAPHPPPDYLPATGPPPSQPPFEGYQRYFAGGYPLPPQQTQSPPHCHHHECDDFHYKGCSPLLQCCWAVLCCCCMVEECCCCMMEEFCCFLR
ncbi:hypothetical protein BT93_G1339 [Corymbia citriodora subsp. variegata]|nr:hypothetical protein BT93_G1339 [Corymbia citriodora subsp. variegata]